MLSPRAVAKSREIKATFREEEIVLPGKVDERKVELEISAGYRHAKLQTINRDVRAGFVGNIFPARICESRVAFARRRNEATTSGLKHSSEYRRLPLVHVAIHEIGLIGLLRKIPRTAVYTRTLLRGGAGETA